MLQQALLSRRPRPASDTKPPVLIAYYNCIKLVLLLLLCHCETVRVWSGLRPTPGVDSQVVVLPIDQCLVFSATLSRNNHRQLYIVNTILREGRHADRHKIK